MADPRSLDAFEMEDLRHLAEVAHYDLAGFISRNPHHASLPARLLFVGLCQGGAQHFVDGTHGLKDFDVWMFFAAGTGDPIYPVRRRGVATYEGPRFQNSTRRIDVLGRTLKVKLQADPALSLNSYLSTPSTSTAWHLAQRPVVALWPEPLIGQVIWRARSS